jgi:hypothetical protein
MASDRRRPPRGTPRGPSRPPVDPEQAAEDVRRFAQLMKAKQDKERKDQADARQRAAAEKRRVEDEAAEARRAADAASAKDRAARRLRDARARGRADEVAEAEAAYKAALAEQITVEQGERPTWAPAPPPELETAAEAGAEAVTEGDEPAIEAPDGAEPAGDDATTTEVHPGASDDAPSETA